jgi:hypothetical protein
MAQDGLERLRYAWEKASIPERAAFLREVQGRAHGSMLEIYSQVGGESLEPFVLLQWQDRTCTLSPEDAREHALKIVDCAEAAVHDAFLVRWLLEVVGSERTQAFGLLQELRAWRQRRAEMPEDPEGLTG